MDVDNEEFKNRKNLLFASLETAEKSINKDSILNQEQVDFNKDNILFVKPRVVPLRNEIKQNALRFRGKESIFKREEQPIEKCLKPRNVPSFKVYNYNLSFTNNIIFVIYFLVQPKKMDKILARRCGYIRFSKYSSSIQFSQRN